MGNCGDSLRSGAIVWEQPKRPNGHEVDRSEPKQARISSEKSCGSSHAAKCPPLSTSLKYTTLGYALSTQVRGVRQISPGNVVKPTGIETDAAPSAATRAFSSPSSQYERAADAPVPVSQYRVMLSRMCSRVRLPEGCLSTNARAIFR